jgi:uncharacterized protein DUF5939
MAKCRQDLKRDAGRATHYVCGLCDVTGDTYLDDFIEVTFTVSPQLRRLPFHDPDSLSVEDFHWKLRFWNDGRIPGQQVRFLDFLHGLVRGLAFLPPQSTTTLRTDLGPGALAGVNVRTQAALMVPVAGKPATTPTLLRIRYDGQRFSPSLPAVPPGPIVIEVENSGTVRGSLLLINWPPEMVAQKIKRSQADTSSQNAHEPKTLINKGSIRDLTLSVAQSHNAENGRGDRIRTCDLVVPNHALYQAKLRPDLSYQKCLAEISSPMNSPA